MLRTIDREDVSDGKLKRGALWPKQIDNTDWLSALLLHAWACYCHHLARTLLS